MQLIKPLLLFYCLAVPFAGRSQISAVRGSFYGGQCAAISHDSNPEYILCGNWYFSKNSSVVFSVFSSSDTLIKILGTGRWKQLADGDILITLKNLNATPLPGNLKYEGSNSDVIKDSIEVSGEIIYCASGKNENAGYLQPKGVVHFKNYVALINNDSFYFKAPRTTQLQLTEIFHSYIKNNDNVTERRFYPDFTLSPGYNRHHLIIELFEDQPQSILIIKNDEIRTRIIKNVKLSANTGLPVSILGLYKMPALKNSMARSLQLALIQQPLYHDILSEALRIIETD